MEPGCRWVAAGRAEELTNVPQGAAAMVTSAEGKALGAAVLGQAGAPEADGATGQTMQPLSFLPMEDGAWAGAEAGDRVVVELVCEVLEDQALVPVSAVDGNDQVWFVDGGAATPVEIDLALRNDAYVAVPQEWAGKRVVLLPETAALYPVRRQGGQGAVKRYDFWKLSLLNIFAAPARSVLTVLGMAIGIGAILAVITLGDAGRAQVKSEMTRLGIDRVWLTAAEGETLRHGDAQLLASALDATATEQVYAPATARAGRREESCVLVGCSREYMDLMGTGVLEGRDLYAAEWQPGSAQRAAGSPALAEKLGVEPAS